MLRATDIYTLHTISHLLKVEVILKKLNTFFCSFISVLTALQSTILVSIKLPKDAFISYNYVPG